MREVYRERTGYHYQTEKSETNITRPKMKGGDSSGGDPASHENQEKTIVLGKEIRRVNVYKGRVKGFILSRV